MENANNKQLIYYFLIIFPIITVFWLGHEHYLTLNWIVQELNEIKQQINTPVSSSYRKVQIVDESGGGSGDYKTEWQIQKPNFALESLGAKIVKVNAKPYNFDTYSLFGYVLCHKDKASPKKLLNSNMDPGECWAFQKDKGSVVIKLALPVLIDGVTIEHIPKFKSPTGEVSTAPKNFTIYGLDNSTLKRTKNLGNFAYDINKHQQQFFPIKKSITQSPFEFIEFNVMSNHGNQMYTCVYKLQVHGSIKN